MAEVDQGLASRLRHRWDYEAAPEASEPFESAAVQINLHRVELAVIVSLANSVIQIYLGLTSVMTVDSWLAVSSLPVLLGFGLAAAPVRHGRVAGLRRALPVLLAIFSLGLAQAAVSVIAQDGRLTSGYPLVVLAVALVFIFPPRTLMTILGAGLISYAVVVLRMPVTTWEKAVAVLTGLICTAVATASGLLIYSARRRDHEQRAVIWRQNQRLIARDRELDDLMAVTAHDLRSPLLGLRNLMTLATERSPGDAALLLQVMVESRRSVEAMLSLIGRLLDDHQADRCARSLAVIDLHEQACEALARVTPLAKGAEVDLSLRAGPFPILALGEPGALAQILDNLLTNAIQASSPGDRVVVSCQDEHGRTVLAVEDQGPGVREQDRSHIFRKFWRAPSADERNPGGAGLGLFIVRTLCERIGAEVRYAPAPLSGARFEIRFAPHPPPEGSPPVPPERPRPVPHRRLRPD
jgi:signal transduction histidine kinase